MIYALLLSFITLIVSIVLSNKEKKDNLANPYMPYGANTSEIKINKNLEKRLSKVERMYAATQLLEYISEIKPDYILTLNEGGVLIGSYVKIISLIPDKYIKECVAIQENNEKVLHCVDFDLSNIKGKVLIIDTIVRTGDSMRTINKEVRKIADVENVYNAVLVTKINNLKPVYEGLSFCVFVTNSDLNLPWKDYKEIHEEPSQKLERFHRIVEKGVEETFQDFVSKK